MRDSLSRDLARTGMAHRGRAQALLAELGLHPGQEFLLAQLFEQDGRSPGDLASCLNVESPTVSKAVRRLAEAGLVAREPDPHDGRRTRVVLTDEGRALRAPLAAVWDRLEAASTAGLDDGEVAQLRELLGRVRAGLDQCAADD